MVLLGGPKTKTSVNCPEIEKGKKLKFDSILFGALLSSYSDIFVYFFVVPVSITNRTAARDYCAIHTP